jgi:hypothetical protein
MAEVKSGGVVVVPKGAGHTDFNYEREKAGR